MPAVSLATLPAELIDRIADLAGPGTHFSFALASRRLHGILTATLEHHARCHQRFHVASDILPSTLLELLVGGKLDRIALWHVRSVEIWGGRLTWADWIPYLHTLPENPSDEARRTRASQITARGESRWSPSRPFARVFFTQDELDAFTALMEDELHFDHASAWQWRVSIEDGCDIALKGLVVGLCPRLENLRVVMTPAETQQQDVCQAYLQRLIDPNEHVVENVIATPCPQELALRFIGRAIRLVVTSEDNNNKLSWPPGFASLRDIAVGIRSLATPAHNLMVNLRGEPAWLNTPAIAALFALPDVKSLYAAGLVRPGYNVSVVVDPCLKQDSSSIRRLFLSECTVGHETILRLIEACATVKTLTFQRCDLEDIFADTLGAMLERHHLRSKAKGIPPPRLVTYACKYQGYRSQICDPWECAYFSTIAVGDLVLYGSADEGSERPEVVQEFAELLAELLSTWPFPFINLSHAGKSVDWIEPGRLQVLLDRALTRIFETDLVGLGWDRSKLRAIFLGEVERPYERTIDPDKFCFRKAIVAGKKIGVEVVTAATPISDDLRGLLPRGASEKDLESSPWWGHRCVEDVEMHPDRGLERAGCNSCGKCKSCYDKYPKELWRQRDAGTYFTEANLEKWMIEDEMRIEAEEEEEEALEFI